MKFLKHPEADAKALSRNILSLGLTDQESITMLADTPIPCSSLQVWKRIASRRNERLTGESFSAPLLPKKDT